MKSGNFDIKPLKTKIEDKINSNKKIGMLTYIAAILVTICISTTIVYVATEDSRTEKHNITVDKKGDEYLYKGDLDKAIEQYNDIRGEKEGNDKLQALKNIKIADTYSLKGDLINYKKYIDLAKEVKNQDDEVLNRIVFSQYINGDVSTALKEGDGALKVNPNNKQLTKTMIAVYMANGNIDGAKGLLDSYNVDKLSAYDLAEYSKILMTLGDYKKGLSTLKEAWIIDKDELKIYDVLAQVSLYNKDKLINGIKELQKTHTEELAYKMWLAKVYSLTPETSKEAENIILELKNKVADSIEMKFIEAAILHNLGNDVEGEKLIEELLEKNPNDYRVLHTAAWQYLRKGKIQEAMDYCKRSIEQNESYPDNYAFLMPEILKHMENASSPTPYYLKAILKEPYNYNILISAANYYWDSEQNSDKAIQYFSLASTIKPDEPEIKYSMALLYFNEKKDNEAVQALKESIKLKAKSVKYHRTLGTVYLTIGKAKEGIEEIRTAFKYDEKDILTLNNAGCYYAMYTDDFNKANTNLKKAYEGINQSTDEYTKKIIKENYDNVRAVIQKIQKGKSNESIIIPDFRLLY